MTRSGLAALVAGVRTRRRAITCDGRGARGVLATGGALGARRDVAVRAGVRSVRVGAVGHEPPVRVTRARATGGGEGRAREPRSGRRASGPEPFEPPTAGRNRRSGPRHLRQHLGGGERADDKFAPAYGQTWDATGLGRRTRSGQAAIRGPGHSLAVTA